MTTALLLAIRGRSLQLLGPIRETLCAFDEGRLAAWIDVIRLSHR
jgi:hypothetical protein